jgi:hypothetical protein
MTRKIIPVTPDSAGRIVARAPVLRVFDTNGAGELLELVSFMNLSTHEVVLQHQPASQVYVEIEE